MGILSYFMRSDGFDFAGYLSYLFVAFFAFAYHEYAHAISADSLGDDTPRIHGRITLNPFPHIDRVGFFLLAFFGFGWASTPVNPGKLRGNWRHSHAVVAVAGPVANLIMAIFFALLLRVLPLQSLASTTTWQWVPQFFWIGVWLNCLLLVFNLMPIPPLDGFTILVGVLPPDLAYQLQTLRQYGMYIFLGVFFLLPFMGFNPFGFIFSSALSLAGILAGISV